MTVTISLNCYCAGFIQVKKLRKDNVTNSLQSLRLGCTNVTLILKFDVKLKTLSRFKIEKKQEQREF